MENKQQSIYTIQEVAEIMRVHQDTVKKWIERGELSCVRLGHRTIRILQSDVDQFILLRHAKQNNGKVAGHLS